MRNPRVPTVAAAAKRSRQAATEQDSLSPSTSSAVEAVAPPDQRANHRDPVEPAQIDGSGNKVADGCSRQANGAGSRDSDEMSSTTAQEPSAAGASDAEPAAAGDAARKGAEELSVAILLARAILMFLASHEPVPVRQPRLCEEPATFELVVVAQAAIAELKKLHPALFDRNVPLSERPCGLLATEEAAGFLVRDVMGCPLLHKEDALSYGETVRKRAEKAAKSIATAQKACRGPYANAAERDAAKAAARLRVLRSAVDPPLPPVRDAPAAAAPAPAPPPPLPPSRAKRWLKHHVTDDYTLEDYLKERAKCAAACIVVRECRCAALTLFRVSQEDRRAREEGAALAAPRARPGDELLSEDDARRGGE